MIFDTKFQMQWNFYINSKTNLLVMHGFYGECMYIVLQKHQGYFFLIFSRYMPKLSLAGQCIPGRQNALVLDSANSASTYLHISLIKRL